jgi:hypothetical protein
MGMSTAVVLRVNKGKQVLSLQTNALTLAYSEFQLVWTQTSADKFLDTPRWAIFAFGSSMPVRSEPNMAMQMMLAPPYDSGMAKPTMGPTDGIMTTVIDDCTLLNLRKTASQALPILPKDPRYSATGHIMLFNDCNKSVAAVLELAKVSTDCAQLVDTLLKRDFTAPIPAVLAFLCQSPCLQRFLTTVQQSITTCGEKIKELDAAEYLVTWQRMLKKLIMVSSAKYYVSISCYSNHVGMGCVSVHPHNIISKQDCTFIAPKDRTLQAPSFSAISTASSSGKCTSRCVERLNMYVYQGGCCVQTVEDAAQQFWRDLGLSQPVNLDVGDRTDAFETRMNSTKDQITFLLPASCPGAGRSGMTTDCVLGMCGRPNWPPAKCCNITCVQGEPMLYLQVDAVSPMQAFDTTHQPHEGALACDDKMLC